jgi:signal transduction histidine kinase
VKNEENSTASGTNQDIPWENFVKFVRQLSHDLRNQLNAAELQSALIGELTSDEELKSEARRLRELVSQIGITLQSLSTSVAEPRPTLLPYTVQDFITDLQKKIGHEFPEKESAVKWDISSPGATLNIDPQSTEWAALELVRNAFRHGMAGDELHVKASAADQWFTFCIREPKAGEIDPTPWMQPLQNVSHGHYSLGLRRARSIITAHGGELTARFDPASRMLISTITLPCSTEKS